MKPIMFMPFLLSSLLICACSSKKEVEVQIIENNNTIIKEKLIKCDVNIMREPEIRTNSMHEVLDSVTRLMLDGYKLRETLPLVPCINLHIIDTDNNISIEK